MMVEDGIAAYKRGDYGTAIHLWRPLAEQGDAKAQAALGIMYANGEGVPQDYAEAVKWWRKAAEQGDAGAQAALGIMYAYAYGEGVPQDYAEAATWYRKAAEQGLAEAQGDEAAQKIRDAVESQMTPDQIAEAQRMAREWMAKHQQ